MVYRKIRFSPNLKSTYFLAYIKLILHLLLYYTYIYVLYRALTLASPEIRFHIDSETHDPIDVQAKEIR